jgi:hypothetical protein
MTAESAGPLKRDAVDADRTRDALNDLLSHILAARLASLAEPGGTTVSRNAHDHACSFGLTPMFGNLRRVL